MEEVPNARVEQLLEHLDQLQRGISLLGEENEMLRQSLGLSQEEVDNATSQKPKSASVRGTISEAKDGLLAFDHAGAHVMFVVGNLWKKASVMHGSMPSGDLSEVQDSDVDAATALRMSAQYVQSSCCRMPRIPVSPNSIPKLCWDMLGLLLICWDVFYIPLTVLDLRQVLFTDMMDWITLLFWTFDVFVSFVSGFFRQGELVMNLRAIAVNYLSTWFLVDLIVVVPDWVTTITSSDGDMTQNFKMLRAFRALRILRLLRLLKLQRLVNIAYDFISSEYAFIMIGMLRLVIFIIVLNHVIACGWYLTGKWATEVGLSRSWLTDTVNGNLLAEDKLYQYTTSLHWSLTQFTPASMEVSARNVPERVLSIAVLFFALITFSSFVGSITTSMTALRSMRADTKKQFWMLRRYLGSKKISYATRSRIIKFLEFQSAKRSAEVSVESIEILNMLSVPLQNLLQYELRKQYIEAHPFFAYLQEHMRPIMIRLTSRVLKFTAFAPEDVVFRPGEESTSLYVVQSGDMEYRIGHGVHKGQHTILQGFGWVSEAPGGGPLQALWGLRRSG
ncbi:unnamed protein product [Effrenium voratum]|uniref:Cyclic nucleotide-binding domain-containing protein n=1 Tax=Effrenium voratum TaxID=2562239 RepID=A0AA36NKJ2_9DINO|nr:unnamed protein product [Effrenium voratum]